MGYKIYSYSQPVVIIVFSQWTIFQPSKGSNSSLQMFTIVYYVLRNNTVLLVSPKLNFVGQECNGCLLLWWRRGVPQWFKRCQTC